MTDPKFDFRNWLLYTQLVETYLSDTPQHRAEELCDLINVAFQDMEAAGFDPVSEFERRVGGQSDRVRQIALRYRDVWGTIVKAAMGVEE